MHAQRNFKKKDKLQSLKIGIGPRFNQNNRKMTIIKNFTPNDDRFHVRGDGLQRAYYKLSGVWSDSTLIFGLRKRELLL